MVLNRLTVLIALLLAALPSLAAPALAHENHQQEQLRKQVESAAAPAPGMTPGAMQAGMEEHLEQMEAQQPKTVWGRLVSWLGRMHPFAVHFPIALFPVALIALIFARRRGETVELIRALIIVAGAGSVIAASLGWLSAGFVMTDRDPIQLWHRWIGTGLAGLGLFLAVWAWRRRDSVNSKAMVTALTLITVALMAQGWLGGGITHGMQHMMF